MSLIDDLLELDEMMLTPEKIQQIATHSLLESKHCSCIRGLSRGWESLPGALAASTLLKWVGQVSIGKEAEPTLDEYHPAATHFRSEDAPICFV
ncbi:hypothetical protein [Pseudomonas sp. TWP3-1]|uniref:hypothetical protein n=1 Tax=Pseudomonas sp. TWP3-1 TaxID=2804631 RepID=UPI003CE9707E